MLMSRVCFPILLTFLSAVDTAAFAPMIATLFPAEQPQSLDRKRESGSVNETSRNSNGDGFRWTPQQKERRWIYIVIHHSGTSGGSVEAIHREHRQRKDSAGNAWLGIGYHFVIGNGAGMEDGNIEPTFRWRNQIHGAHSGSAVHNANGIGICLIGNFTKRKPTEKQVESVTKLIRQLSKRYNVAARLVIGHNRVRATSCPGRYFPLQKVVENALENN